MGEVIRFPGRQTGARTAVEHRPLLWREAVGHELRRERTAQGRTQGEVADVAGISVQYLSEIERGRKEPSSEILEAAAGALGLTLGGLARRVADALLATLPDVMDLTSEQTSVPDGVTSHVPDGPVLLAV